MIPGSVRLFAIALLWLACSLSALSAAETPAVDPRYPAMAEWAKAGVRDTVPRDLPVLARVTPGNDVQAALDTTAAQGGGVVELSAGDFVLTSTLLLRSGVILRGAGEGQSRLVLQLRGHASTPDGTGNVVAAAGVLGSGIRHAGLERLTVVFDLSLPAPFDHTAKQPYVNNPDQRDDLWVVSVRFTGSEDCWITSCRILNSGTDPLRLDSCRHLTIRDLEVVGAHNKGNPDAGSVVVSGSEHVLLDHLMVRDIRHVVLKAGAAAQPCRYNVLVRSQLAVDVTLHGAGTRQNLITECTLEIPPGHPWTPFGIGEPKRQQPPGSGNLIHRCRAAHTFGNSKRNYSVAGDQALVYTLITDFKLEKKNPHHVVPLGPAPTGGTLYRPPPPPP